MASASAVASKGVPLAGLLKELLASPSASDKIADAARRLFIVSKLISDDSSEDSSDEDSSTDEDAEAAAAERNLSIPKLFSGDAAMRFPEAAMRDLLLALAEDGGAASMTGYSPRGRSWVSKEDADAVHLKVAMPGLGKEHVKMRAEKDTLLIKGEGDKDAEGDADKGPRYNYSIGFPSQAFKMDQIKAEMKNGMLMVTVPKIKDEERKDVFEIKVE